MSDAAAMDDAAPPARGGNGSVVPVATGPGTDFMAVAIGSGANVEGLPAYFTDPLLATGNMPGIAISAFNNRALRQGTFVASSLCQWISDQTNLYVYDDGDQINWISEWQNALAAFVEALIPPGPNLGAYLPLAGGQMVGNITFQTGITTVLANNTWYRGLDTAGQARGLIIKDSANNVTINDGSSPYVVIGGAPVANNNFAWSGKNSSGTILPVIGLLSDNNIHIGSATTPNLYIDVTGNVNFSGNIVLATNHYVFANDSGGTARQLLGLTTANALSLGGGVTGEVDIYGNPIYLRANATATGTFQVNGYTYLQGGARSYIPGGNDPHQILADNGYYARHHYIVTGTRNWSVGCVSGGNYVITDESAAAVRWQIDLNGNVTSYASQTVNSGLTVGGNIQCNSSINASGNLSCSNTGYVYNQLQVWNSIVLNSGNIYAGSGSVNCGSVAAGGNVQGGGLVSTGNSQINGSEQVNGNFQCNNLVTCWGIQCNGQVSVAGTVLAGGLHSNVDTTVGNNLQVSGSITVPNGGYVYISNAPCYATAFVTISDSRVKENVQTLNPATALSTLEQLRPVSFNYTGDATTNIHWGFIAQEVQSSSMPTTTVQVGLETTECPDGQLGVDFDQLQSMLIASVQDLAQQISTLTSRIAELEGRA